MEQKAYSEDELRRQVESVNADTQKLNQMRAVMQHEIDNAKQERIQLEQEFIKTFGTSDLEQIEAMIKRIQDENIAAFESKSKEVKEFARAMATVQEQIRAAKAGH